MLKVYNNSENYAAQVCKLPEKVTVTGLDNLVAVTYHGNTCLISKNSDPNKLYLFFPTESQISHEFLSYNNLYKNSELNIDKNKKGFFEENRRVKTIKFKGVISSGFIIPIDSLSFSDDISPFIQNLKVGDEFNEINKVKICEKYIIKIRTPNVQNSSKIIDEIIDSKFAPEHFSTDHLMKNYHRIDFNDYISVTHKLHGTSARYFNTITDRKLSFFEKLLLKFNVKIQTTEYSQVVGSRRVIKSINYNKLESHYYKNSGDIWTKVGEEYFKDKLNKGEAVYCEIIGKNYNGESIQHGYDYNLNKPIPFIYRISNINSEGIEIDLSYQQMKERAEQLGVLVCPELFYGTFKDFINKFIDNYVIDDRNKEMYINHIFYNELLEKPSVLDPNVIEEGFCIRVDKYPKPNIYKIKSKSFLLKESNWKDKQIIDIEEQT